MTIFKKELYSYFASYAAYAVFAMYVLFSMLSTFYIGQFFLLDNSALYSFFYLQPQVLAIIVPSMTMRLWSEEQKQGTMEFLLTQPLSYASIVAGKFFASFAIGVAMLLLTIPLWFALQDFKPVDNLNILSGYIGCIAVIGVYCAIGCMVSVFSKNSLTAYLFTVLLCWLISSANISSAADTEFVSSLNFYHHFAEFAFGQISPASVVYFIGLMGMMLWINLIAIDHNKLAFKIRNSAKLSLFIAMLAVSFVLLNVVAFVLLGNVSLDVTDSGKHTLSAGSKEIIRQMKSPVMVNVYLSADLKKEDPRYEQYTQEVLGFLQQYQKASNGNITVSVKNPEPYSDREKEAESLGISHMLDSSGKMKLFFGASFTDRVSTYAVSNFSLSRQAYLEQDISRILYKFAYPEKTKLGVILPRNMRNAAFLRQLASTYNIAWISPDNIEMPDGIDALLVVNPPQNSKIFTYAFDQYLMRGGKALLFIDPYSPENGEIKTIGMPSATDFRQVLKTFGAGLEMNRVVGDKRQSGKSRQSDKMQLSYPLLQISEGIGRGNAIGRGINLLSFAYAGGIEIEETENIKAAPLVATSADSGIYSVSGIRISGMSGIPPILEGEGKSYVLAALFEGRAYSSFSNSIYGDESMAGKFRPIGSPEAKLLVVADSDILNDANWIAETAGTDIYHTVPRNNSIDFVRRAVDYLTGNELLLEVENKFAPASKSIGETIYDREFMKNEKEFSEVARLLGVAELTLENLTSNVSSGQIGYSLNVAKEMDSLRESIGILQNEVNRLEYQAKKETAGKRKGLIASVILIPFLVILGLWLLALAGAKKENKKALELADER